jgi:BMFP domain-containing protein YqiC
MHYNKPIDKLWVLIMFNAKKIEDIAKQVSDAIPPKFKDIANDIEEKTKVVLQRKLSQLDVVSREEFDVQTQVLLKTREKLADLEHKLAEIEAKLAE